MPFQKIKVLVVNNSPKLSFMLRKSMPQDSAFQEIKFVNGFSEAVSVLKTYRPDVILAENQLQGEEVAALIEAVDIPVVVMSRYEDNIENHWERAADFVFLPKCSEKSSWRAFCSEVCVKLKIAAASGSSKNSANSQPITSEKPSERVILIGASTGGTDATAQIIRNLPDHLPGIVIVQHMPSGFTKMYAQRLNDICGIRVAEAKDGDRVECGKALIAPGGLHLVLKKDRNGYYVHCIQGERVNGHCPSVGVLFDSAAKIAGPGTVGVLLTGMGKDGAEGLLHMRQAGAYTIGQDKATCVVYGMPMEAFKLGAVVKQAPLHKIADLIVRYYQ